MIAAQWGRDRRGNVAWLVALILPVLFSFGLGGIAWNQAHFNKGLLQQTVRAAALAATNKLSTYYTSGSADTLKAAAQAIAVLNMPVATYGTVVQASNIVVGTWNSTTKAFTSGGTSPNAVQVTGLETAANGNPVTLFFGSLMGLGSFDISAVAVASFGTGQTFNTIVINDLSHSFSGNISDQRLADTSILNCIATAAGSLSKFGITGITGDSAILQPLLQASTTANQTTIKNEIAQVNSCNNTGMPSCSGSNVASGLYSAIQQFSGSGYTNAKNSVIIITDGVPNAHAGKTYTTADGIGPTISPATGIVCTTNCTSANLWTMATNQAAAAVKAGISISTIYYSGNTTASSSACTAAGLASSCTTAQLQTAYANKLALLTGGTGISLVAPTAAKISSTFAAFCATMASALKASQ